MIKSCVSSDDECQYEWNLVTARLWMCSFRWISAANNVTNLVTITKQLAERDPQMAFLVEDVDAGADVDKIVSRVTDIANLRRIQEAGYPLYSQMWDIVLSLARGNRLALLRFLRDNQVPTSLFIDSVWNAVWAIVDREDDRILPFLIDEMGLPVTHATWGEIARNMTDPNNKRTFLETTALINLVLSSGFVPINPYSQMTTRDCVAEYIHDRLGVPFPPGLENASS